MSLSKFKRLGYFDNMKLSSMTAPQVKKWQNSLFQEGLSNNYIRTVHQILQQVLDLAVKLGMLPNNVAKTVGNVKKTVRKLTFGQSKSFSGLLVRSTNQISMIYFISQHFGFLYDWCQD